MSVDLARMTAYIGLQIQNQLDDAQIQLLVNLTHMEEVEARPWARLQTDFAFNSFALYTTGTVSFTQNSPTITGAGTAWTTNMTGMVMRIGTISGTASTQLVPIPIAAVDTVNQIITLQDPYPLAGASGMGYQIFPLFYSIRGLQRVLGVRQQVQLGRRPHGFFNQRDPYRYNQSSPARFWAPFGQNHDGSAKIELWPIETIANPYSVYGLRGHVDLQNPTDLPLIPSGVIVNKTIGKCSESLYSLTGDQRWITQRDFYYGRYKDELANAIESDREEYGVINQIQDSQGDPDSTSYRPSIDSFYNRDTESF